MFDVTTYGAVGDGTTDDRAAIQDAIDAAGAAGGGVVYFPKGVYLLDSTYPTSPYTGQRLVSTYDHVFLKGEGPGVSIIKNGANINASTIDFEGTDGGGISDLEIHGNTQNNASGHGIRGANSVTNWTARNLYIHHNGGYGIGLQFNNPGTPEGSTYKNIIIEDVVIEDTGLDGIDIKNNNHNNYNNKMVNVTVRRAGLRTDVTGQACLDLRGPWNLTNISCFEFSDGENTNCQSGIRFRPGETSDASGTGAHFSTLTNFYVDAGSTNTETFGVHVIAYGVSVSGGVVVGTKTGVQVEQRECTIGNVYVQGGNNGFLIEDSSALTNGDRVSITGCTVRSAADSGFKIYTDNVILNGIQARSCTNGVNLRTGSTMTVISGVASGNTTNFNKQTSGITWKDAGFVY